MSLSRRAFLSGAAATSAFAGFARAQTPQTLESVRADAHVADLVGYGPLENDPAGLFDLPRGFSYRIVSRAGQRMDDGLIVPGRFDGMGCFPLDDERVILVRNHENGVRRAELGAFGPDHGLQAAWNGVRKAFDRYTDGRVCPGGTTTVVYNLRTGRAERQHLSLAGTLTNCAGGATPGGSWLTCEEIVVRAGAEVRRDHGWVFEVPSRATGLVDARPIAALGRFMHEATATDPRTGIVYQTEDKGDPDHQDLIYRFLPNDPRDLHAGGRLQALGFRGEPEGDTRNRAERQWSQGDWREVVWLDLGDVENLNADLHLRGRAAGAAWIARGEGIHVGWGGELFITATKGGPLQLGQVLRYAPSPYEGTSREAERPGRLQLFVESTDAARFNMGDNLAMAPSGHLMVCEDKAAPGGVNYLRGVTPEGFVYTFARNAVPMTTNVGANAELAGVCMSPDGSTLFVNVYTPGMTLAVTGPWARFSAERV